MRGILKAFGLMIGLAVVISVFTHTSTLAVELSESSALFTETVPAKSQSAKERDELIPIAFKKLLVRLSGTSEILEKSAVKAALKKVDIFVSQFTFEGFREKNEKAIQKVLKVTFAAKPVQLLVQRAGYTVWDSPRPNTVVWLGVEEGGEPARWVNEENDPILWQSLADLIDPLKIPVVMPLLDMVDESEFNIDVAIQKKYSALPDMMHRYGAGSLLLCLLHEYAGGWHAEWYLFNRQFGGQPQHTWETVGLDLPETLKKGVDKLGLYLAGTEIHPPNDTTEQVLREQNAEKSNSIKAEGAVSAASQSIETEVAISGIRNSKQYAQVLQYLKKVAPQAKVEIKQIATDYTVFSLQPGVDRDYFLRRIGQEAFLVESEHNLLSETDPVIYCELFSGESW